MSSFAKLKTAIFSSPCRICCHQKFLQKILFSQTAKMFQLLRSVCFWKSKALYNLNIFTDSSICENNIFCRNFWWQHIRLGDKSMAQFCHFPKDDIFRCNTSWYSQMVTISEKLSFFIWLIDPYQLLDFFHICIFGKSGQKCWWGKHQILTQIHHATKEQERIEEAGGQVHNSRLNGDLEISRSFGDLTYLEGDELSFAFWNKSGRCVQNRYKVGAFDIGKKR